jgi:hypothetical protein
MNQFIISILIIILGTIYADNEVQQQSIAPISDEMWWAQNTDCEMVHNENLFETKSNAVNDIITFDDIEKAVQLHIGACIEPQTEERPYKCQYYLSTVYTSNIAMMSFPSDQQSAREPQQIGTHQYNVATHTKECGIWKNTV